ncbi:hypothetical protein RSOLAG1IB_03161 [Rhizoctonia solani AG-1 IB]|uniref:Transmembrane protein n=1 Tax=Thanatephorus cucumeris (strain AG1-IB / isolate 7/3/14) TaxID=1108050 RepID=A0A0B7FSN2_THACB|nr:hypothetical protein RSOLAG1IB_03161 [Rhizoctonia solani AG-1 IB]
MVRPLSPKLAVIFLLSARANATPWSDVTCTNPNTAWTFNSLGQSPCLIASYLGSVCRSDNTWRVPALTGGSVYYTSGSSNKCICTSVVWSLLAACSLCQELDSSRWAVYSNDCTTADIARPGTYPIAIPPNVTVPNWAYYDFVTSGVFNLNIAQQQSGPESAAPPGPTNTSTTAASSLTSYSTYSSTSPVPTSNDPSSSSPNTGAIVGGVLGGVLGIALLAAIAFIVVRKNRSSKPGPHGLPPSLDPANPALPTTQYAGAPTSYGQYQPVAPNSPTLTHAAQSYYKPYDPSDPSTFPPDIYSNTTTHPDSVPPLSYSQRSDARPAGYNGAPEI